MSSLIRFSNARGAREILDRLTIEQLIYGINRGAKQLAVMPDGYDYATGGCRDWENFGHPNIEMDESVAGWQHYGRAFVLLRLKLETAMVDSYQEIIRRGSSMDVSHIKMIHFPNWRLPERQVVA